MAKIQECVCLELTALGDSVREQDFLVSCSDSLNLPQTQIGIRISHKQLWHFGENSQTWRWKKNKDKLYTHLLCGLEKVAFLSGLHRPSPNGCPLGHLCGLYNFE